MHSNDGPASCTGDINNDGLTDFYIGGAAGEVGQLFLQESDGRFRELKTNIFHAHKESEDIDCIFTDVNGDLFDDIYVASGSSEFGPNNAKLADRIYINNKRNNFEISPQILPSFKFEFSSAVDELDFDQDGDQDLIITTFQQPFVYGLPSDMYLLENDGTGVFKNMKRKEFSKLGMMTDVDVFDVDHDGDEDFVVVGEWMSPTLFINENGNFKQIEINSINANGFWNTVETSDLNNDGFTDIIAGNCGVNTRITANIDFPFKMYVNDFDQNGKPEQIFTYQNIDGEFVLAQRNDLLRQLPYLAKEFTTFKAYSTQNVSTIFSPEQISSSLTKEIRELNSGVFWNKGDGTFTFIAFPVEAQMSSMYDLELMDVNNDSRLDIIIGGNQYRAKPELGISGASKGLVLQQMESGEFKALDYSQSGISIDKEIRSIETIQTKSDTKLLFVRNNDKPIMMTKND